MYALLGLVGASADDAATCKKISVVAGQAMEARQRGDLMEEAMTSVGDNSKFTNAMIVQAYTVPVVQDDKERQNAVSEYRNLKYAECYRWLIEPKK
ncbi:MAG: hypothetical protein OXF59_09405 [Pseudomonas sp.]|nr:hypothetical protein [Pseudomonas sp.]